jgi:hypothetical protein
MWPIPGEEKGAVGGNRTAREVRGDQKPRERVNASSQAIRVGWARSPPSDPKYETKWTCRTHPQGHILPLFFISIYVLIYGTGA